MKYFGYLACVLFVFYDLVAHANGAALLPPLSEAPMCYRTWKDQQVMDAKNQVVRLSNAILILKSKQFTMGQNSLPDGVRSVNEDGFLRPIGNQLVVVSPVAEATEDASGDDGDSVTALTTAGDLEPEAEISFNQDSLNRAIENLDMANSLSIEDYFAVYLRQLSGNDAALKEIASQMSKEEVLEVLKAALKLQGAEQEKALSPPSSVSLKTGYLGKPKNTSL